MIWVYEPFIYLQVHIFSQRWLWRKDANVSGKGPPCLVSSLLCNYSPIRREGRMCSWNVTPHHSSLIIIITCVFFPAFLPSPRDPSFPYPDPVLVSFLLSPGSLSPQGLKPQPRLVGKVRAFGCSGCPLCVILFLYSWILDSFWMCYASQGA